MRRLASPAFAGVFLIAGAASHVLLTVGRFGVFAGLVLTVVSGVRYTASWIRVHERRAT